MPKARITIYGIEEEQIFDSIEEAEDEAEYLGRVMNKICKVSVVHE